jgi:hypothetical protein
MSVVTLNSLSLDNSVYTAEHFELLQDESTHEADAHIGLLLDPPYQRAAVWTMEQRTLLMRSLLCGLPVPAAVINDRSRVEFTESDGRRDERYAVVDGRQRIETLLRWVGEDLPLPASWFDSDYVERTFDDMEGRAFVNASCLTTAGRRLVGHRLRLPTATAQVATLEEEAAIYLLLNAGGVAHTEDDLIVARQLAGDLT